MRIDRIHNSIVGKGEDPTKQFLKEYFKLEEYDNFAHFYSDVQGIYPQVPIPSLLDRGNLMNLREDHGKSSVDLVVLLIIDGYRCSICIRVQGKGHQGEVKSRFDKVQERMLEASGHIVININYWDCPELFKKDKLTEKSKQEIIESFKYKFPLL